MTTTTDTAIYLLKNLLAPNKRRANQLLRLDLLHDRLEKPYRAEITQRFSDPDNRDQLITFRDFGFNPYKAVINRLAQVYREQPRRFFMDESDDELWRSVVVDDLDQIAEQVNRVTVALNECLVVPRVRGSNIDFDIITPDTVELLSDGLNILAVCWVVEGGYEYWDGLYHKLFDARCNLVRKEDNLLGEVPVVTYRRARPLGGFWLGEDGNDLVSMTFDQLIRRAWENLLVWFNSHPEMARKPGTDQTNNYGTLPVSQASGPSKILDGEFQVLDVQADIRQIVETTARKLEDAAASWGVSEAALKESELGSGLARLLATAALSEYRMNLIKHFRPADQKLMSMAARVWNAHSESPNRFSDNTEPRITYGEPRLVLGPLDELQILAKGMENGTMSPVDYMLKHYPDLSTRDEALERMRRNLQEIGEVIDARARYNDPELLARITGAVGGQASGESRRDNSVKPAILRQAKEK